MKYNQPLRLRYKCAGYALIGVGIFLCAFAAMPVRAVGNMAAGAGNADVKVLGTSNVHDWSMEDKDVACSASLRMQRARPMPECLWQLLLLLFPSTV